MEIISKRLRTLRESVKLSQKNIAQMIGITQVSINRYENNYAKVPPDVLLWYADKFNVSMDYIYGRTDNPQGTQYEYKPEIIADNKEMQQFVEMCFDPNSPINNQLKETLIRLLQEGEKQ